MRRCWLPVILAAAASGALATPARAQEEIEQMREQATLHFGLLHVRPTFELQEVGLDSNVFNESGAQSPDFTATAVPGANLGVAFARRALIRSTVTSNFVYYHRLGSQRSIDPNVEMRGTVFLRRVSVWADGAYQNSRQRLNQEVDARARRFSTRATLGVDVEATPRLTFTLSGGASRVDYADDQLFRGVALRESLAADSRSGSVSAKYQWTPLTSFHAQGDLVQARYVYSTFKNVDQSKFAGGIELQPRALVSGSAYVGVRRLIPQDATVQEYSGPTMDLSLRYTHRSATRITLSGRRDAQVSYQSESPYYVATVVGLSVRRQLVGSFDTTVGIERHRYRYLDRLTAESLPERVDITRNLSGDIGYRIRGGGRIGVGISHWRRESNRRADVGYSGYRVGSTLSYEF